MSMVDGTSVKTKERAKGKMAEEHIVLLTPKVPPAWDGVGD